MKSLVNSSCLISLFIIIFIIINSSPSSYLIVVEAGWQTYLQGQTPSTNTSLAYVNAAALTTTLGGTVTVVAQNPLVRVTSGIDSDRSVIPLQCVSNTDQLYGWNTYRSQIVSSARSQFWTPPTQTRGSRIFITLQPRIGYSTSTDETITCTIAKPAGSDQYYTEPLSDYEKTFSFVILKHTACRLSLIRRFNRANLNTFVNYESLPAPPIQSIPLPTGKKLNEIPVDMYEKDFRQDGVSIDIIIDGGAWKQSKVADLAPQIKCKPLIGTLPNCLDGFFTAADLSWDSNLPSIVSLRLSRDRMRTFNIDQVSQIYVDLPSPLNEQFSEGGASLPIQTGVYAGFVLYTMPFYDPCQNGVVSTAVKPCDTTAMPPASSPIVQMRYHYGVTYLDTAGKPATGNTPIQYFSPITGNPIPNNTLTVTEDCVRGRVSDTNICPLAYLFSVTNPERHLFTACLSPSDPCEDIRRWALSSKNGFPWGIFQWMNRFLLRETGQELALLWMKPLPDYETVTVDEININIPFSSFTTGEPMVPDSSGPLTLRITPSDGYFVGDLHDINQSDIWFSNVSMCLRFGGESFKPSFRDTFIASDSFGNITLGWDVQKSFLLSRPGGNVSFGTYSNGQIDYTRLCFTLAQYVDYEMVGGQSELVTFTVNSSWTQSGRSFTWEASPSFVIFGSPGEYTLVAAPTVEEATIKAGGYVLRLQLAGQKFLQDLTQCKLAICAAWNSSSSDSSGWNTQNSILCSSFTSFDRIDNRTLEITLHEDSNYDTLRGETITTMIPTECTGGVVPIARPTFTILPQNGNMSFEVSFDNGRNLRYADSTLESNIRSARIRLYVRIFNDTWDNTDPTNVTTELLNAFVSLQNEPYGWNSKKPQLISSVTMLNSTHIEIQFRPTATYDITSNETLELPISPSWVSSRRSPQNPIIYFKIVASAGDVTLRAWTGTAENRDVTEDDVRWGKLWFSLSLSGDQWRRDVAPYISSFSSNQPNRPTSLDVLIPQLMPSMRFFQFTVDSADGSEILRLQLQSSSFYDISQDENVTLKFDPNTVASGIAPLFFVNGQQQPSFSFLIRKTPARIFLSGEIYSLNEKKMRQSQQLKIFFTLLGETWKQGTNLDNSTAAIIENINAIINPFSTNPSLEKIQQNGFAAFKASIIPKARVEFVNNNVLLLYFMPNRNYEIGSSEYIEQIVPGFVVNSGLQPFTKRLLNRLWIEVTPTGGELRILPADLVLNEATLRSSNFTVLIAVDGDRWNQNVLLDQSVAFVASAFGSTSSPIQEKNGFDAMKEEFLNIGGSRRPFLSSGSYSGQETLQVRLNPVASYDIVADETILFSLTDAAFLSTGLLPEPNVVTIPVKAAARVIVLVIEQTLSKAIAYRTNLLSLKTDVSKLLGVPVDRQNIVLNGTAIRSDGMLAVLLNFLPAVTSAQKDLDRRTPVELSDTFLSLTPDYLYSKASIRFSFLQDKPLSDAQLIVTPPPTTMNALGGESSFDPTPIFVSIACIFILLMGVGFVIFLRLQRATISTAATRSSRQKRREIGSEQFHDEHVHQREQVLELSVNPMLRNAGNLLVSPNAREHKHFDMDDDLYIVPQEAHSLRQHVRNDLGIRGPENHVEQLKRLKETRSRNEREIAKRLNPSAAQHYNNNNNGISRARYQVARSGSPASGSDTDFEMKDMISDPNRPGIYSAAFYSPQPVGQQNSGAETRSPNGTSLVPIRREFKMTNRAELRRLERLMSL